MAVVALVSQYEDQDDQLAMKVTMVTRRGIGILHLRDSSGQTPLQLPRWGPPSLTSSRAGALQICKPRFALSFRPARIRLVGVVPSEDPSRSLALESSPWKALVKITLANATGSFRI